MKRIKRLTALCFCAVIILTGCTKFGTAVVSINEDYTYDSANNEVTVTAIITNDGGCSYYREQGFCFRQDTFPKLNDVFSDTVRVFDNYDPLTLTDTFSKTFMLPLVDTTYWVCAYVKNNAGVSYSKAIQVSTKIPDSTETEKYLFNLNHIK